MPEPERILIFLRVKEKYSFPIEKGESRESPENIL